MKSYSLYPILVILISGNSSLAGNVPINPTPFISPYPGTINLCQPTTLDICGNYYPAAAAALGAFQTYTLPDRYVDNIATFQCVSDGFHAYYKIADNTNLNCKLKTCSPNLISLCGNQQIPISDSVSVGEAVTITIPNSLITNDNIRAPEITARCLMQDGNPQYQVENEDSLSCSIFSCPEAQLNACNTQVTISGGSDLGTVIRVNTDDKKTVIVECLGTEGLAPRYQVIEEQCD